jgi:hypothetical protein
VKDDGFTKRFIIEKKLEAGVDSGAVLLNIAKLGRMTKDQFLG